MMCRKIIVLLSMMLVCMVSCVKDPKPSMEQFQILKEKEKVTVGTDGATIVGEYAYSGGVDSMKVRVGTEEHLYGSDDYDVFLNGKSYYVDIKGLQSGTLYYYRYIVDYGAATVWQSDIYTFTTASDEIQLPTVVTMEMTGVTTVSASCLCNVVDDGGAEVKERGVCWSKSPHPDISSHAFANGGGLGEYEAFLLELEPNTVYYVRAYARNSKGVGYGEELTFTTLQELEVPLACLNGFFSVAEDRQVWFSQGNLMYKPSMGIWGLAEQQSSVVGYDNANIGPDYGGWIDLFGWGTSGYDHGAVCYQPWSTVKNDTSYYAYGSMESNLYDQTGQADWGYGVVVEEGDAETHPWRTLSFEEWNYLFHERVTPSGARFAKACVEGVNGVLLLPDDWNTSNYGLNNINQEGASFGSNIITMVTFESEWETRGVVFLPASGWRKELDVKDVGSMGLYWTASAYGTRRSIVLYFENDFLNTDVTRPRSHGCSVRLVRDVVR